MATTTKFQFDKVFEVDGAGYAHEPEEVSPQFSEDDLTAARAEGQQMGFDAGLQQARGEIDAAVAGSLQVLGAEFQQLEARHQQALLSIRAEAAELAMLIASKLAPELIRREPTAEIEALIAQCLSEVPTEPRVVIRVAEGLVDQLQENINGVVTRSGFNGQVALIGEPGLALTDCRIEWADGGAEREAAVMQAHIEDAISRYRRAVEDDIAHIEASQANLAEAQDVDETVHDGPPPPPEPLASALGDHNAPEPLEDALPPLAHRSAHLGTDAIDPVTPDAPPEAAVPGTDDATPSMRE